MSEYFILVDCNNFYVACEQVFDPCLRGRPVVVLSNNDGCVVARSPQARSLGIGMGEPFFQCSRRLQKAGGVAMSANFALYGDMSARVMRCLHSLLPSLEIYSIDEAFAKVPAKTARKTARQIQKSIPAWTGIAVSVGAAPTKTLAKIANRTAKKENSREGVCVLDGEEETRRALDATPVRDIWGVGGKKADFLRSRGIFSALDLCRCDPEFARTTMTIRGWQLRMELAGKPCLDLQTQPDPPKSIISSRSFAREISDPESLRQAICAFAARSAERLRERKMHTSCVHVSISTNRFHSGPGHAESAHAGIMPPTNDSATIIGRAAELAEKIMRRGTGYKKAGVMLTDLVSENRPATFFEAPKEKREKEKGLLKAVDSINSRWGRGTLRWAAAGSDKKKFWEVRREKTSPAYTTKWEDLPVARIG